MTDKVPGDWRSGDWIGIGARGVFAGLDAVFVELVAKGADADAEEPCGVGAVAVGMFEGGEDALLFDFGERNRFAGDGDGRVRQIARLGWAGSAGGRGWRGMGGQAEEALDTAGAELSLLTEQEAVRWGIPRFIGKSATLRKTPQDIRKLQPFNTSVLIAGESGTGKELVALNGPSSKAAAESSNRNIFIFSTHRCPRHRLPWPPPFPSLRPPRSLTCPSICRRPKSASSISNSHFGARRSRRFNFRIGRQPGNVQKPSGLGLSKRPEGRAPHQNENCWSSIAKYQEKDHAHQ